MSRRLDEAIRLGVGLLVAAAAAGLLVLVLQGRAEAADGEIDPALQALLPAPALSLGERLDSLETMIEEDRQERFRSAARMALAAAWKAGTRQSVRGAISGARSLWRAFRLLRTPSSVERRALALLEAEMRSGTSDDGLEAFHSRLIERARERRLEKRISGVTDALRGGDVAWARMRLGRLRDHAPTHPRVASLEEALSKLELRRAEEREFLLRPPSNPVPADANLLQALLLDDVETVCRGSLDAERSLSCAAGLYSNGSREEAVDLLERTAEGEGNAASIAARWLGDERIHPEALWTGVGRQDSMRKALGWIGGRDLEERGFEISSRGLKAWRTAASPLNLAVSAPVRMLRGHAPARDRIRRLALYYLDLRPTGPAADEARGWLARTEPSEAEIRRQTLFDDGMLVLPRARTRYTPVVPRPLLVTRALLLEGGAASRGLAEEFGEAETMLLVPLRDGATEEGTRLARHRAVSLVANLVVLLEGGVALPVRGERDHALGALRRLDRSLRSGGGLVARPLAAEQPDGIEAGLLSALEGEPARVAGVEVRSGRDDLKLRQDLFGSDTRCPEGVVCLERKRALSGQMYAQLEIEGEGKLGVVTSVRDASLRIEIDETGPQAKLDLPVAALLGIDRWLPLRAAVAPRQPLGRDPRLMSARV
jgi:hypothetical protein